MGLRDLFKVRKPGNGNAWQKKAEAATRAKISITDRGQQPISGPKTSI